MRMARLVGLSPDGRYVIVATDHGEELAIAADDRLRAALRGDRPRLGQLEIEMESALSPREIQTRIRSGESVDDVTRVAGIDRERVERFAAPVIAEREHVAGLAMTSSARRRGETSSHRTLRGVLNERLLNRSVDIDTVRWDSHRLDDGRWAVTADYLSEETPRQALFYFDLPGRYSVAGNDEGRWVLGDTSPAARGTEPEDTEPTLDLSDELALVRAIQDIPMAGEDEPGVTEVEVVEVTEVEVTIAEVFQLNRSAESVEPVEPDDEGEADEADEADEAESGLDALYDIFEDQDPLSAPVADEPVADPEAAEPTIEVSRAELSHGEVHSAPSDASAVPELDVPLRSEGWEPAIIVDYPVEPSEEEVADVDGVEVPEGSDDPGRPERPVAREDRRDEADSLDEPEDLPLPLDLPDQPTPTPAPKPARRKRASVPSWDEIVFGGPKEK